MKAYLVLPVEVASSVESLLLSSVVWGPAFPHWSLSTCQSWTGIPQRARPEPHLVGAYCTAQIPRRHGLRREVQSLQPPLTVPLEG